MKIVIEANSIDELVGLLERLIGSSPNAAGPRLSSSEHIDNLGLTLRTRNSLAAEGIETIDQLSAKSDDELLSMQHIGRSSLADIRCALHKYWFL